VLHGCLQPLPFEPEKADRQLSQVISFMADGQLACSSDCVRAMSPLVERPPYLMGRDMAQPQ